MAEQGVALTMLHFETTPDETEKALRLMDRLDASLPTESRRVVVPHTEALKTLSERCRPNLTCVLCRRLMLRVAGELAEKHGAAFVITGESLGQVASQTLKNIFVEEEAASLPVLRPIIGMDKTEIERIAKEIGTFDISISSSTCCGFAPVKPSTASSLEDVLEEEKRVSIDDIVRGEVEAAREMT